MNAVAVIPARFASQRLPGKPLADIAGKPMIQHVYERAAKATRISNVIVATDDQRIQAAVESFGGNAVMTPADLQSGTDRIAFATRTMTDVDIIVNVQGDEPLIEPAMIDQGVALVADSDAVIGTLVKRISEPADLFNPNTAKVVLDNKHRCLYFSRSPIPFGRDREEREWLNMFCYYKHIGMYIFRRDFLLLFASLPQTPLEKAEKLEQLRVLEHGYSIHAAVTPYDSIPVDTPEDLQRVRNLVAAGVSV